jgi:hypothetical protein
MLGPGIHPIFKLLAVGILLLIFFASVLVKSKTLEITYEKYVQDGVTFERAVHTFHWDRFGAYIKDIPEKLRKKVKREE